MEEIARLEIKAVSDDLVRATKRLDAIEKQGKKTDRATSSLTKTLGSFAIAGTATAAATTAMWSAFNNIRSGERLNAMLKTSTGSAMDARIAFAELADVASQMPNSLEDVTRGFVTLKNLGLDASERSLMSFANTAAAMGKSLDDFIQAVADAATTEFERLKEFGIRARNQGEVISFTFKGVTKTVENSSEAITEYLRGIGEVEFAGSVADQMDTIDGKLSNLGDAWFQFTQKIGGKNLVKDTLDLLTEGLNELSNSYDLKDVYLRAFGFGGSLDDLGIADLEPTIRLLESMQSGGGLYEIMASDERKSALSDRIEELLTLKEQNEALKAQEELEQRIKQSREVLKIHDDEALENMRRRSDSAYELLKLEEEILRVRERLEEGIGSPNANEAKLQKLEEERRKLFETRGREIVSAKNTVEGFFDGGKSKLELLVEEQDYEKAYLFAHKDLLFRTEEDYQEKLTVLEKEHSRRRRELKSREFDDQIGSVISFFDTIQSLSQGSSKKLFKISKALGIARATKNVYEAASEAFVDTKGGVFTKLIAAALASSYQLTQLAAIRSTEFTGNFTTGGIVPGNSFHGDRLTAGVNSGEVILDFPKQKRLLDIADGKKGGAAKAETKLNVVVNNYSSESVDVRRKSDGQTLEVIVGTVKQEIASGIADGSSQIARTMQGVYGLRRRA